MLKNYLMKYCAPTLAGIKTGNLFSVRYTSAELEGEIRKLNIFLVKKGLRLIPIRRAGKSTLVYLYRPNRLKKDLQDPVATEILKKRGYSCGNPDRCLAELIKRLKSDDAFPHEIGLFLSYPPADVNAFMRSPCEGVKCCGCWKAYDNECEAKKVFDLYKRCTDIYDRSVQKGMPLESLIYGDDDDIQHLIYIFQGGAYHE